MATLYSDEFEPTVVLGLLWDLFGWRTHGVDAVLARAQAGDQDAFHELIDPYCRELQLHCYRILGSLQDAEDVLQETLLSAWQALGRFDGRSLRAWLYRVATNRCLNFLRNASRQPTDSPMPRSDSPFDGAVPSDEPWWLEPYPDALIDDVALGPETVYETRESVALSFVAALQQLPGQQRAILVLRDVLGFSAAEAAEILNTTRASINSALQRARAASPRFRDSETVPLPPSARDLEIVDEFVRAWERCDIDSIVSLLTDDARIVMPPSVVEVRGRSTIAEFLQVQGFWGKELKVVPAAANRQPTFGYYLSEPQAGITRALGLIVLTISNERVVTLTHFMGSGLLSRFGLPRSLPKGTDHR